MLSHETPVVVSTWLKFCSPCENLFAKSHKICRDYWFYLTRRRVPLLQGMRCDWRRQHCDSLHVYIYIGSAPGTVVSKHEMAFHQIMQGFYSNISDYYWFLSSLMYYCWSRRQTQTIKEIILCFWGEYCTPFVTFYKYFVSEQIAYVF